MIAFGGGRLERATRCPPPTGTARAAAPARRAGRDRSFRRQRAGGSRSRRVPSTRECGRMIPEELRDGHRVRTRRHRTRWLRTRRGRGADAALARVWTDGRIQCDVCPRFCKLHEGQRGLCFVRARQDDAMVLTTYGRSSGFCIDPIEKKPLNHFLPGTPVFSFGTAGCNLTCKFCQNWDISKAREVDKLNQNAAPRAIADGRAAARLPVGRVHLQRSGDLPGICGGYRARLPRGGVEDRRGDRGLHHARRRAASSTNTSTRRMST